MDPKAPLVIRPEDTIIAIMGMTGAGKSTFISSCTKQPTLQGGGNLFSCTTKVTIHSTIISGRVVHLIDTPGFNDSGRSDGETFEELAYWLAAAYERDLQLSGIIYLHRITDIRLQGSAWRALRAFQSMCGDHNLDGVVIATTMWNKVAPELVASAFARHEKLRKKIHQDIGDHGGSIVALTAGSSDAMKAVEQIVRKDLRMTLALQRQLVVENKPVYETDAGKILFEAFQEWHPDCRIVIHNAQDAMTKAIQKKPRLDAQQLRQASNNTLTDTSLVYSEMKRFGRNLSDIRLEWEERLRKDGEAFECESRQNRELLEAKIKALKDLHRSETSLLRPREVCRVENSLKKDLECLNHRQEVITWSETKRLDKRYAAQGGVATGLGVVGTTLALGQLLAAVACIVM